MCYEKQICSSIDDRQMDMQLKFVREEFLNLYRYNLLKQVSIFKILVII